MRRAPAAAEALSRRVDHGEAITLDVGTERDAGHGKLAQDYAEQDKTIAVGVEWCTGWRVVERRLRRVDEGVTNARVLVVWWHYTARRLQGAVQTREICERVAKCT